MQINSNSKVNFTGANARQLKGLFMTADWGGIASEIKGLEKQTNLKVFSLDDNLKVTTDNFISPRKVKPQIMWSQDLFSFTDNKLFIESEYNPEPELIAQIGRTLQSTFKKKHEAHTFHVQGGNHILVESNGKKEVLVGRYDYRTVGRKELEHRFETDTIHEIPQVAAHIDAFMFVDDKKRAFICDDELTINEIIRGIKNTEQYMQKNFWKKSPTEIKQFASLHENLVNIAQNFYKITKISPYPNIDETVKILDKAGYETVRIPARIYTLTPEGRTLQHVYGTNFANAILHKNNNGDTVLITNDSSNDAFLNLNKELGEKIDFSFKKIFMDRVTPYIKKENIHFIKGNNNSVFDLLSNLGGIHCASSEII